MALDLHSPPSVARPRRGHRLFDTACRLVRGIVGAVTDDELRAEFFALRDELCTEFAALKDGVDENRRTIETHISEVAERQALYELTTNSRLRRRAFKQFAALVIAVAIVAVFAGLGIARQGQRIEQEAKQRDAVSCQDRSEAREGVRLGYVALLEARTAAGTLLVPADSPVRGVLTNDVLPKLPIITCPGGNP